MVKGLSLLGLSNLFSFVQDVDAVLRCSESLPNELATCLLLKAKVLVAMRQVEVSPIDVDGFSWFFLIHWYSRKQ